MPLLVTTIVNESMREIGDVPQNRITEIDWLQFYNDTTRQITLRWQVIEEDATFDIAAEEDRYLYPEQMVQMKRLRYSETPSDILSYKPVNEIFEDEMRAHETHYKDIGDVFDGYWARAGFFQIRPRPILAVTDGGLISYWKRADKATVLQDAVFALPEMFDGLVRDRMVIRAKKRLARYDEMAHDLAEWEAEVSKIASPIEDRSDDRRPQVRPYIEHDGLL